MAGTGVCCASLEEPKTLMKMGLCMVLVGHVNFLLGALVHGVVLRHINLNKEAWAMEYAVSNVVALISGLVTWSLFSVSLASALLAAASAVGLSVSAVWAVVHGERSLLAHCRFPDAVGDSSVANECPFDPTRIYVSVPLSDAEIKPGTATTFYELCEQLSAVAAAQTHHGAAWLHNMGARTPLGVCWGGSTFTLVLYRAARYEGNLR